MIISIKPWLEIADQFHHGYTGPPLSGDHNSLNFSGFNPSKADREREMLKAFGMAEKRDFYHESVLARQVLAAMQPIEGKQIFDGTLGGGGHSEMFLENGAHVIGCDQDQEAIDYAVRRLERFDDCFLPIKGNFADMDTLLQDVGIDNLDGILLDLGVSSRQLDKAERGFSFRENGPLDMRMDSSAHASARDLVNELDEEALVEIFRDFGEERRARKVAAEIVKSRGVESIDTTSDLADLVARVIPKTGPKHPATRIFQALRIAVNRELDCLETGLKKAVNMLTKGGVLAVITFHSLEDRMVKRFMRHHSAPTLDRPEWPEPKENPDFCLTLPTRKAIMPDEDEISANRRSRSAKLRVAVKN